MRRFQPSRNDRRLARLRSSLIKPQHACSAADRPSEGVHHAQAYPGGGGGNRADNRAAFAQATTEKSDKKAKGSAKTTEQKLTAQQQKMKDCAPKWAAYKKEKNVKGRAEHRKFMSTCLKA